MARIQNMIIAYGTTVKIEVTKDANDEIIVTEVPTPYPQNEIDEALRWLKKNALNAAIFLVKNSHAAEDAGRWLQTEEGKEQLRAANNATKQKKVVEMETKKRR